MTADSGFQGFSPESLAFLKNVHAKNSKPWFEKNRASFERHLLEPFKLLVEDLSPAMLSIDPEFEIRPSVNRTISTIYRDTRFSQDKSLFKDRMWLTFKRPGPEWKEDAPAYYFEISPTGYRFGMGFYSASRNAMDRFREAVDNDPKAFLKVVAFFRRPDNPFELGGETYKRPLPCDHSPEIQKWYQMKSFYLIRERKADERLFSRALADDLSAGFLSMSPLYGYLMRIRD
jgi:uncharacterized protein (TIGR02453 family)